MTHEFERLFKELPRAPEPPVGLLEAALGRIHRERFRLAIRRKIAWSCAALVSGLCLGFAGRAAWAEASSSGFFASSSLLFSDPGVVAAYWDKFILALLEALPAASVAVLFVALAAFLGSARGLARSLSSSMTTHAV